MCLNKTDLEEFRKRAKILIPQMGKSEIGNHLKKGYSRQTIYNAINYMEEQSTTNKTGHPTSWTPVRRNQLKRLMNNCKDVMAEK